MPLFRFKRPVGAIHESPAAPCCHCEAHRAVAIRIPCGAKHRPFPSGEREENGLPRRLSAPRNDVVIFTRSFCFTLRSSNRSGRFLNRPYNKEHPRRRRG